MPKCKGKGTKNNSPSAQPYDVSASQHKSVSGQGDQGLAELYNCDKYHKSTENFLQCECCSYVVVL